MQAYSLKRENGVTPIVGLHRIPAKKHPYGALADRSAPFFSMICAGSECKAHGQQHLRKDVRAHDGKVLLGRLGLLGEEHGLVEVVGHDGGQGDAAGRGGEDHGDLVHIEVFAELLCDMVHQLRVDAVVQKAIHLDDVAGQDLAFAANAFLEQFHGTVLLSYNISARAVLPL